jgi:hypothetical protein
MDRPHHSCEVRIAFPTARHAEQTLQVMQVDKEVGDRVTKTLSIDDGSAHILIVYVLFVSMVLFYTVIFIHSPVLRCFVNAYCLMRICSFGSRFQSMELKMLRVSVSSFYDYLAVVLKCFQEFDSSLRESSK